MKKVILITLCIFIALSISVFGLIINAFDSSLYSENITFISNQNLTKTISIYKFANISSAYINFTGTQFAYAFEPGFENNLGSSVGLGFINRTSLAQNITLYNDYIKNVSFKGFILASPASGNVSVSLRYTNGTIIESVKVIAADSITLGTVYTANFTGTTKMNGSILISIDRDSISSGFLMLPTNDVTDGQAFEQINGVFSRVAASNLRIQYYGTSLYYPSNFYLVLNKTFIFNSIGNYTTFNQTNNFAGNLSQVLSGSSCNGGTLNGINCTINLTLHSDTQGIVNSKLYINWSESIKPVLYITEPNTTYQNITYIPLNFTATDEYKIDTCMYNVTYFTNQNLSAVANTYINCSENTSFTLPIAGTASYVLRMCINDSFSNTNCTTSTFDTIGYIPIVQSGGGGGSGTIIIGNISWDMKTDSNSEIYNIQMTAGSTRTKYLVFTNDDVDTKIITLSLDSGNASKFITLNDTKVEVQNIKEISTQSTVTISIPELTKPGKYLANIIATDENGNVKSVSVIITVGVLGNILKLTSAIDLNGIKIPYILISLVTGSFAFIFVKQFSTKLAKSVILPLSLIVAIVSAFAILFII